MKKMFLAFAAASLVSTMAFAQDDYDYGDDYGTEASTSSDDGYTDMDSGDKATTEEKPASDVEYKNMDEGKKVSRDEGEMSSIFDRPFNFGGKLSAGFAGFWNRQEIDMGNGTTYDPYAEWLGVQVSLGVIFNYHINSFLSVVPELNFEVRSYFRDSDDYVVRGTDDYGWRYTASDTKENLNQYNLLLPIMVRYNPHPQFYLEAGPAFSLNLFGEFTVSSEELDFEETLDSWECNSVYVALQFGLGYTANIGNNKFGDIGLRFSFDMNKLETENDTKAWSVQLIVTGYVPM